MAGGLGGASFSLASLFQITRLHIVVLILRKILCLLQPPLLLYKLGFPYPAIRFRWVSSPLLVIPMEEVTSLYGRLRIVDTFDVIWCLNTAQVPIVPSFQTVDPAITTNIAKAAPGPYQFSFSFCRLPQPCQRFASQMRFPRRDTIVRLCGLIWKCKITGYPIRHPTLHEPSGLMARIQSFAKELGLFCLATRLGEGAVPDFSARVPGASLFWQIAICAPPPMYRPLVQYGWKCEPCNKRTISSGMMRPMHGPSWRY